MFRPIFHGILGALGLGKHGKANKILKGESKTAPDRTVHIGNGFRHGGTKCGRYFRKAIAKRRMRNKMGKETRQKQRLAMR